MKKLQNIYLYFKLRSIKDIFLDFFKFIFKTWIYTITFLVVFCSLMNYVGYNSKVVYLEKDNNKIVLVGTIHISTNSDYYNNISNLNEIYKLEDYKLYYETIDYNENASKETKKTMKDFEDTFSFFAKTAKLKQQNNYLNYKDEDVNADIDFLELEKLQGVKEIKLFTSYSEVLKNNNKDIKKETVLNNFFDNVLKYYFRASLIAGLHFNNISDINKNNLKVILDKRNKVLINSIDYNKNAIINYGDIHLPEIIKELENKGYKVVAKSELKAF